MWIDLLVHHEAVVRLSIFFGAFLLLALWEAKAPKRSLTLGRSRRWGVNWLIAISGTLVNRGLAYWVAAGLAVGAAWDAQLRGVGLLNTLEWPLWLEIALAILAFDLLIYIQHVASHKIPLLWRLHRVHHVDRDIDVTTAIRFHPIEIALSMLLKIGAVYVLGPAPAAVILFEILLNGCAMFNHANLRLPLGVDRVLRLFIVTPDMHRVHHSARPEETDSNYGFNLPWWDRLFGTYRPQPKDGHDGITIGLNAYQDERPTRFGWSLIFPFLANRRR